jgi:predicted nucleotidyltransferase component of viral defense system
MTFSRLQAVEIFHLIFTSHLGQKINKELFALKGGCNLRFYFQSIRYSEDIDFDIHTASVSTLKKNVEQVLNGNALAANLRAKGIEIANHSAPKQTEITQRWKVSLRVTNESLEIPTKIEFSRRRPINKEAVLELVDPQLISSYGLLPLLTNHYPISYAQTQKIGALIGRTETQARDVFDLDLLLSKKPFDLKFKPFEKIEVAIENAMSVGFEQYQSQVISYLAKEYQSHYGNASYWNSLLERVVSALESLR